MGVATGIDLEALDRGGSPGRAHRWPSACSIQPDALFRIASVSKPITSAAIMKLVEEGKLKLDDRVAPFIAHLTPAPGATVDPRWEQITIRHLLNHTGGWDRDKPNGGFDPMYRPAIAAAAVNAPAPASAETIIRYMKGMPLDFNPGEKFAYSNFGYAILGRVIERLSGMPYEEYVRTRVLQPVGANRTRQGKSRMSDALADEVKYYWPGAGLNAPLVPSVFPGEGMVPLNYGGFYLEARDATAAGSRRPSISCDSWPASMAAPIVRTSSALRLVAEMTSNGATVCADGACYYAGWMVCSPNPGRRDLVARGRRCPARRAILVRSYHNFSWVALFNARPADSQLRRRARCRAMECACGRHIISDARPVFDLPMANNFLAIHRASLARCGPSTSEPARAPSNSTMSARAVAFASFTPAAVVHSRNRLGEPRSLSESDAARWVGGVSQLAQRVLQRATAKVFRLCPHHHPVEKSERPLRWRRVGEIRLDTRTTIHGSALETRRHELVLAAEVLI